MIKHRKQGKKKIKLTGIDRFVDLLEHIGTIYLYLNTNLDQNNIAKKLSMDIHRVNTILKDIKKISKNKYGQENN